MRLRCLTLFVVLALGGAGTAMAQQTGSIAGRVTDSAGLALPGVTVEARSSVLPTPRTTVTGGAGEFRFPALQPGTYRLTFELAGMQTRTREALVQLQQETAVDVQLDIQGLQEEVTVTATSSLVDRSSATISSGVSNEQILSLPVGQEYRDLIKLIPAVQYTQDEVRGPSAGASGQDNVYQFDGVNVTLPLFGTLSAEPASHDIDQVTTVRGGARAVDFDRSGGFTVDSVSKSGTNRYTGQVGFQFQTDAMSAGLESGTLSQYEQDRTWTTAGIGGPILQDQLFFYGSYYRPTRKRANQANLYGELPEYESTRNEGFLKLTYNPISSLLLNFSYRDSKREDVSDRFASDSAPTTGSGDESRLQIGIVEGSWIINSRSHLTFKYTNFGNRTTGRPDFIASASPTTEVGTRIDLTALDTLGRLTVPTPVAGQTEFNAFVQPLIDRYGYDENGVRVGGGTVGYGSEFNDQDFFRNAGQVGFNVVLGTNVVHELHFGYQLSEDAEDLVRGSNGWGLLSVPGGRLSPIAGTGQRAYYTARFQQQSIGIPKIRSEYRSQNFEVNDTVRWNQWTFNLGLLMSNDTLYGQGLREDSSTLSGYVSAPGEQYEMYDVPFSRMIQPRVGATYAYNDSGDTVYASYARYQPSASSLPRAASWDRNLTGTFIDAHFDRNGVLFATVPVGSSSGKLFVEDMTPRTYDEFLVGTSRQINPSWSVRAYGRYREGSHFWEDTNNTARLLFDPPPDVPRELYIPDLSDRLRQIGSGSSYVIAELDGAYTEYWEATLESEWRGRRAFVRGSYTWSRYTGNFDQDNSTTNNDDNIFIGSSFIADGAGRQLWDFKDGRLRGDRPHMLKLYGYYQLGWDASVGAYVIAQSGHPWEAWSYEPYIALTNSTSVTNRYAEPAGSRRTDAHYQLDLNYTQNFRLTDRLRAQVAADLFNVFDKQTGYNPQPSLLSSVFGVPRTFYDPRRIQLAARLLF